MSRSGRRRRARRDEHRQLAYPDTRPYSTLLAGRRRRPVPDHVAHYYVPLSVLAATDRVMRRYGEEGRECYVWWGGYFTETGEGQVVTAIYPETATEYGRIHLVGRQLHALHQRLRDLDQVLLAELHTHPPGAGGQNDVDAAHPAATYYGFMSIVVPDFAFPQLYDLRKTHVYEYLDHGRWRELEADEIAARLVIEESILPVVL